MRRYYCEANEAYRETRKERLHVQKLYRIKMHPTSRYPHPSSAAWRGSSLGLANATWMHTVEALKDFPMVTHRDSWACPIQCLTVELTACLDSMYPSKYIDAATARFILVSTPVDDGAPSCSSGGARSVRRVSPYCDNDALALVPTALPVLKVCLGCPKFILPSQ